MGHRLADFEIWGPRSIESPIVNAHLQVEETTMKRHLHLVLSSVALLSMVAACGGDDGSLAVPGQPSVGGTGSAPVDLSGLPKVSELGSCTVTVTGDVTAEWVAAGGAASVGYGPWFEGPAITTSIGDTDETFFILDCDGGDGGDGGDGNYVGFLGQNEIPIPMAPATYVISAGDSLFGSSSDGPIGVLISLESTDTNWKLNGAGELVITEFDSDHIAGGFTLPITDAFAELNGTSKGDAVISGTFVLGNPN